MFPLVRGLSMPLSTAMLFASVPPVELTSRVLRRFENVEVLKIGHERELDLILHGCDLEVGHHRAQLRHGSRSARTAITDKARRLVVPLTVEKVDGVLERPIHAVVVLGRDKDLAVE